MWTGWCLHLMARRFSDGKMRIFAMALTLLAVSCANRPEEAENTRTLAPMESVNPYALLDASIGEESVSNAAGDGVHTVLALSQGGFCVLRKCS